MNRIENIETYDQILREISYLGTKITGSYTLIKFPRTDKTFSSTNATARETFHIIVKIIMIRGLPRFIARLSLHSESKFENLMSASKMLLIWTLIKERKKFLKTIRSIKLVEFDIRDIPKRLIKAPFFPLDRESLQVWSQKEFYLIPDYSNYSLIDLRLNNTDKKYLLTKMNKNSSQLLWKFLNESFLNESEIIKLKAKTPIIGNYITDFAKLRFLVDGNAHLTIDQVFTDSKPIRKINNAEIWHAIYIIQKENWIIKDITEHPKQKFVAGHKHLVLRNTEEVAIKVPSGESLAIESGFLLTQRCDDNWYHFLIDLLPQVVFLKNLPPEAKVIVRNNLPDTAKAILKYLDLNTIFVDINSKIYVKNLYYIPHRSSIFDSPVRVGNYPRMLLPEQAILKLRDKLNDFHLNNKHEVGDSFSKVFISRTGEYRNCINLAQVEHLLSNQGFRKFEINNQYLKNQFTLFRNSDSIVLSGGAIAANIIFMRKNTYMVVLGSWRSSSLGIWSKLGSILGVKVKEIKGIPISFSMNYSRRLHANYFVPRVLLMHYLKK